MVSKSSFHREYNPTTNHEPGGGTGTPRVETLDPLKRAARGAVTWLPQKMTCRRMMTDVPRYPLAKIQKKLSKDPPFLMGKSTISTGPFSIANYVSLLEGKVKK